MFSKRRILMSDLTLHAANVGHEILQMFRLTLIVRLQHHSAGPEPESSLHTQAKAGWLPVLMQASGC